MVVMMSSLSEVLDEWGMTKELKKRVIDVVNKRAYLYKVCQLDISNVGLFILCKNNGISTIGVLEDGTLIESKLDLSYKVYKALTTLDAKYSIILCVKFKDNGKFIDIVKCSVRDVQKCVCKKPKTITYAVTDGIQAMKLRIFAQDVKGAKLDVYKGAVCYAFNKNFGKKCEDVNCYVVAYS